MPLHKKYKLLLIILPVVVIIIFFLAIYRKPVSINQILAESSELYLTPFGDEVAGGNSWTVLLDTAPVIQFRYTLGSKITYPFAGLTFYMRDKSYWDFTSYDHFKIKVKATKGIRLPLAVHCLIPNHSKPEKFNSYYRLQYTILVKDDWLELEVPLRKYEVPGWWYGENDLTEHDLGKPDLSKVYAVSIANCTNLKAGDTDEISIEELTFYKSLVPFYISAAAFLVIYFGAWWVISRTKTNNAEKPEKEITFQYEKLEAVSNLQKEEEAVFNFITTNYSKPDLTIIDVQNAIEIHERKISSIIKNKTELNFKQFLNKLRVTEAKRLLIESDMQISEIALKTGYTNVTHFNRVFKSIEDCSPNDFRKKNKSL